MVTSKSGLGSQESLHVFSGNQTIDQFLALLGEYIDLGPAVRMKGRVGIIFAFDERSGNECDVTCCGFEA